MSLKFTLNASEDRKLPLTYLASPYIVILGFHKVDLSQGCFSYAKIWLILTDGNIGKNGLHYRAGWAKLSLRAVINQCWARDRIGNIKLKKIICIHPMN